MCPGKFVTYFLLSAFIFGSYGTYELAKLLLERCQNAKNLGTECNKLDFLERDLRAHEHLPTLFVVFWVSVEMVCIA